MAETEDVEQLRRRARRRLVGAAAVVLFLVVVPPMLMDLEPKPVSSNLSVEIPSPGTPRTDARVAPGKASPDESAQAKAPPDSAKPSADEPKADANPPKPAIEAQNLPSPPAAVSAAPGTPAAAPSAGSDATPAEAAQESYFVPLGTFAERENAQQLVRRASQLGVKVYLEAVATASGGRTRVRAGPFPSRDAAEKARTVLKQAGIDASAVRRSEKRG
jgi:DedD protein